MSQLNELKKLVILFPEELTADECYEFVASNKTKAGWDVLRAIHDDSLRVVDSAVFKMLRAEMIKRGYADTSAPDEWYLEMAAKLLGVN